MTNIRKRHLEIYDASVKVLEKAGGVERIDTLLQEKRIPLLRKMAKVVMKSTDCRMTSAKSNIAKALRCARYEIMKNRNEPN